MKLLECDDLAWLSATLLVWIVFCIIANIYLEIRAALNEVSK